MHKVETKRSFGIICYRFNSQRNCYEFLVVKKQHTYAYTDFVAMNFGKNVNHVRYLLNNMTRDEKRDIASLKYRFIYHKMWMNPKKTNCYYKRKKKFEAIFLADGGRMLRQLIEESKDVHPLWEFPKGRLDAKEPNTECAIREFYEESGYTYDRYYLQYHIKPIAEVSNYKKISFISTYYLAEMPYESSMPMPEFLPSDVDEAKWISYRDCKLLACERLERNLTRVIEHLREYGVKM